MSGFKLALRSRPRPAVGLGFAPSQVSPALCFPFCPVWGRTACMYFLSLDFQPPCLCGWCLFAMHQLLDTFCHVYRMQLSQQLLEGLPRVPISPSVISVLLCAFIAWSFLRSCNCQASPMPDIRGTQSTSLESQWQIIVSCK